MPLKVTLVKLFQNTGIFRKILPKLHKSSRKLSISLIKSARHMYDNFPSCKSMNLFCPINFIDSALLNI